jgi:biotin operon repressor
MQTDEQEILDYLKAWPGAFVSGKEIARKVGGKERFEDDHGWALPILAQLVRHGQVESDHHGGFRLKPPEKKKREQHVSPQLLKILKSSGKKFDSVVLDDVKEESPIPAYRKPATSADAGDS